MIRLYVHVFGVQADTHSFACDFAHRPDYCVYKNLGTTYTESILRTSRSHCNSSEMSNNNFSPSTALPGRRGLYPGKHNEAVGSKDCCLEPGSFALLHERPPKLNSKALCSQFTHNVDYYE